MALAADDELVDFDSFPSNYIRKSVSAAQFGRNILGRNSVKSSRSSNTMNYAQMSDVQQFDGEMQERDNLIQELTERMNEKDLEVMNLQKKVESMKKESKTFLQEVSERESYFDQFVEELKVKYEDHMAKMSKEHQAEVKTLKEKLQNSAEESQTLADDASQLRKRLSQINKDHETLETDFADLRFKYEEEKRRNQTVIEKLKHEVEDLHREQEETEKERLQQQKRADDFSRKMEEQQKLMDDLYQRFTRETAALNDEKTQMAMQMFDFQLDNATHGPRSKSLLDEIADSEAKNECSNCAAELEKVRRLNAYVEKLLLRLIELDPNYFEITGKD